MQSLLDCCPDWFTVESVTTRHFDGRARPANTRWAGEGIALRVTVSERPSVGEVVPGTKLPKQCPERHLYGNSTFCMELRPRPIMELADAARWWDLLEQYLCCQSTAADTGLWPPHHGLDHGREGGAFHLRALELAAELGISDEYFEVSSGLRAEFTPATVRRLQGRIAFRRLVEVEGQRRRAKAHYDMLAAASGAVCCGTMRDCPFPKRDVAASARVHHELAPLAVLLASSAHGALGMAEGVERG